MVSDAAPWAVRRVAPQAVWPLTRGAGVLVAVVDTGVSATAGALAGAVRRGADVAGPGTGDRDCAGRGTALAGIVAARPMAGSGFVGVAPAATVFPVRIVDGRGKVGTNAIARGIRKATEAGADVILVGTGTAHPDDTLRSAVRAAVERDVVVVASVSDDEPVGVAQRPAPWYPAADEDVLAVGGVGTDGAPTEASPAEAGVDLLAPAAGAVSIGPSGTGHYTVGGPAVAAAHVAGAAVLVRAYHPQLTQAEVRRRLELTAEHPRGGGPAPGVGYGTLDLYEAVAALQLGEEPLPGTPPPMTIMAEPPRPDPAVAASVFVAVATVTAAAFGYVSARVIHWGRRRRWRS
ncbi:S8 family serine peptidase [Paractinoplanes hotanensis]|uniref:S8 family serine peptidase n=1 Tax=Paractinoplanes hotanensis TaxID=2906497 RepID=A0ABT0YDX1_9ACTN|nr:S8 family serine peptidase [Actinoplanes hotanensis]MCM4084249.1 S8 family serine peptidase [Actinoplanes hotanensis]